MKLNKGLFFFPFVLTFFQSCSTVSTITTYDAAGNVVKIEKLEKNIADKIVESVRDKTLIIWRSGWAAYISASPATFQDPTPTIKIFAGKEDEGYISIKYNDIVNWDGVANVIRATSKNLSVNPSGITEKGGE